MDISFVDVFAEYDRKFIKMYSSEPPVQALTFKVDKETLRPGFIMAGMVKLRDHIPFRLSVENGSDSIIEFCFDAHGKYTKYTSNVGDDVGDVVSVDDPIYRIKHIFRRAFINAPLLKGVTDHQIWSALVLAEDECIKLGLVACQGGTGRWNPQDHEPVSHPWPEPEFSLNSTKEETLMKTTVLTSQLNYFIRTRDDFKKPMVPGQMMRGLDPVVGCKEFDLVIEDTAEKGIISLTFSPIGAFNYWYSPEGAHPNIGHVFRDVFASSPVAERLRISDIYAALIAAEVECIKRGLIANHYGTGHVENVYIPKPGWKNWKDLFNLVSMNPTLPFCDHGSVPPQNGDDGTRALLFQDQLSRIIGEVSDSATDGDIIKEVDGFIHDNNKRYSDWENAGKLVKKLQDDEWYKIGEIEADLEICRALLRERETDLAKRESVMSDKLNEATGNAILFSHIISTIAGKLDRIAPSGISKMNYTPRSIITDATVDRDQSLRSMALIEEQLGKAKWWKRAGMGVFTVGIAACIYSFAVYPTIAAWLNSQ